MSLNERIARVIEYSELSPSEFAELIEVQRSNISHITSGRNKPSLDFLIKIKEKFPELDWDWLINGTGTMLIEKPKESPSKLNSTSLPDLFSLINDDNFGLDESPKKEKLTAPQSDIAGSLPMEDEISDSQQLEKASPVPVAQPVSEKVPKVKNIVIFYEDGTFESFTPR